MDKIPAALLLAVCLVLLLRMVLPAAPRARLDRAGLRLRALLARGWQRVRRIGRWKRRRQHERDARTEADAAIARAQRGAGRRSDVDWDGNVARPRSFRDDEQPPTLH